MKKVQITIEEELLDRIDQAADEAYTSRSGFISQACNQLIMQNDVSKALADLAVCMRRIADNGGIDEKSRHDLEQFEAFAKVISGK